ncbi:MAG: hypothetical protein J6I66_05880 [Lachnospiraceae bacterium]|nr:hypothetical protein [Lachnospiraceae bacterium]
MYIGFGITKNCRFVIYSSNPNKKDSDDDGIEDDKDSFPLKRNEVFVFLNGYISPHFLNVENTNLQYHNNNSVIAGGDQHWWPGTGKEYDGIFDGFFERFPDYVTNKNYRMCGFGCGVIAATDLELYLCQENGYSIPNQPNLFSNNAFLISQSDYMSAAEYNRDNVFILNDYYVNYVIGVKPTDLESGMEAFLKYNGFLNPTAEWRASADKEIVLNSIERMISENRPIVFSYHTFKDKYEDGICLYKNVEDAKNDNRSTIPIKSHYMNIIGYVKYLNDTCDTYRYLLIVVSNGEIFYINYDFYAAHLDITTNILEIRT